jgi:hypothetical protein
MLCRVIVDLAVLVFLFLAVSGRQDSNLRPPAPKAGALAKLSYAPIAYLREANMGVESISPR